MFNPYGKVVTGVVANMEAQVASGRVFELTSPALLTSTSPLAAITVKISTGQGRGSSVMTLAGDSIGGVVSALRGFDPDYTPTTEEIVRKTITYSPPSEDRGGEYSFLLSSAKHARTITIPEEEWSDFLSFMEKIEEWTEGAVEHYRKVISKL